VSQDLMKQAIGVLTSLARRTRDPDSEPIDFADLAAYILTTVAANVGSVDTLLAGRPGSWEADLVRQLVDGTAGDGLADLARFRTEPVRLYVNAEDAFFDMGINELFDPVYEQATERTWDETLSEQQLAEAEETVNTLDRLWAQDIDAYDKAYRATALRYLSEFGADCGIELVTSEYPDPLRWDSLAEQVEDYARKHTPLPMTGQAPDWSDGNPADALRRAGLTYTARAGAST